MCADGASGENEFLYNKLNEFRIDSDDDKKPTFAYRFAGLGEVCREAWILLVGFPNRNNSRVRMLEARIRQGKTFSMIKRKNPRPLMNNTDFALAFLRDYILENSQRSPVTTELCVHFLALCACLHVNRAYIHINLSTLMFMHTGTWNLRDIKRCMLPTTKRLPKANFVYCRARTLTSYGTSRCTKALRTLRLAFISKLMLCRPG